MHIVISYAHSLFFCILIAIFPYVLNEHFIHAYKTNLHPLFTVINSTAALLMFSLRITFIAIYYKRKGKVNSDYNINYIHLM